MDKTLFVRQSPLKEKVTHPISIGGHDDARAPSHQWQDTVLWHLR